MTEKLRFESHHVGICQRDDPLTISLYRKEPNVQHCWQVSNEALRLELSRQNQLLSRRCLSWQEVISHRDRDFERAVCSNTDHSRLCALSQEL